METLEEIPSKEIRVGKCDDSCIFMVGEDDSPINPLMCLSEKRLFKPAEIYTTNLPGWCPLKSGPVIVRLK